MTDNEKFIIQAFYRHTLDLNAKSMEVKIASQTLLEILMSTKCSVIMSIAFENFTPFVLRKRDVPQFSSIEDCFRRVPNLIINSGLDGISFERMGYLLRSEKRKPGADKKYGENHMKTAALMGLCAITKVGATYQAYETSLTSLFNALPNEDKSKVEPKFSLRIPFIQNYFFRGGNNHVLDDLLSILSESTQIRRSSNCKTLIEMVNHAIDYDI